MKKVILFVVILIFYTTVNGQIFDNYGFRLGVGQSNQYWHLDGMENLSEWKGNKTGFIGQLIVEKEINKFMSFRPTIGYIQGGCNESITWITPDGKNQGTSYYDIDLQYISMDLGLKIFPVQTKLQPYIILGFRGNFLIDYIDELEEVGLGFVKDYNKLTLDGLMGAGISYYDIFYLDFEFNPSLTKNYDETFISIKNRYYSLSLGLNINQIIRKE